MSGKNRKSKKPGLQCHADGKVILWTKISKSSYVPLPSYITVLYDPSKKNQTLVEFSENKVIYKNVLCLYDIDDIVLLDGHSSNICHSFRENWSFLA